MLHKIQDAGVLKRQPHLYTWDLVHIARYFVMLCQSNLSGDVVLAQFDKVNIATYTNLHIFDFFYDWGLVKYSPMDIVHIHNLHKSFLG